MPSKSRTRRNYKKDTYIPKLITIPEGSHESQEENSNGSHLITLHRSSKQLKNHTTNLPTSLSNKTKNSKNKSVSKKIISGFTKILNFIGMSKTKKKRSKMM